MANSSELFECLNFLLVPPCSSEPDWVNETVQLLKAHSCGVCRVYTPPTTDSSSNAAQLKSWFIDHYGQDDPTNFIISENTDFPFYHIAAFDLLLPVVTREWIHMCITTKKLVRTSAFSPDKRHIFKNFQIYISKEAFTRSEHLLYTEMAQALGGTCVEFLSNRTTHLVTKNSQDNGIKAVVNFKKWSIMKFVLPTWLVQSFKELRVVPESNHQILPQDAPENTHELLQDLWDITAETPFRKCSPILKNHNIILGMDLFLGKELYAYLIEFLKSSGATVIRHLDESDIQNRGADIYIGSTTKSTEYDVASRLPMHLGNIIWLFHMWSLNSFIKPERKLIFGPFRKKVFESSQLILTYSNYFGQQRAYIQRLAEILGGYSTPELSRKNTNLISQFSSGKKFDTAKRWNDKCKISNHRWMEECYKKEGKLNPLEDRFQEFPVHAGLLSGPSQLPLQDSLLFHDSHEIKTPEPVVNLAKTACAIGSTDFGMAEEKTALLENAMINPECPILNQDNLTPRISKRVDEATCEAVSEPLDTNHTSLIGKKATICTREIVPEEHSSEELQINSNIGTYSQADRKEKDDKIPEVLPEVDEEEKLETLLPDVSVRAIGEDIIVEGMPSAESTETPVVESESHRDQRTTSHNGAPTLRSHKNAKKAKEEDHFAEDNLEAALSKSQTPYEALNSSPSLHSSGGSRRAAKAKAAQRLHDDIASLNQFQRNSKRKKTSSLLPEELALLQKQKELEQQARDLLSQALGHHESQEQGEILVCGGAKASHTGKHKQLYHINAVSTGSQHLLNELDYAVLKMLGIVIYNEITPDNLRKVNAIIAPKKMRTAKFLISFAFHPLRYALQPKFLDDVLESIYKKNSNKTFATLDTSKYEIAGIDQIHILKMTSLPTKVFERARISKINIINDIPGGVEVISNILKSHGIKEVKAIQHSQLSKLTEESFVLNEVDEANKNKNLEDIIPDCVFIVTKSAQVKPFKKIFKGSGRIALAVEWNWCISSIFELNVNYADRQHIVYQTGL